jgi:hypothetical protein
LIRYHNNYDTGDPYYAYNPTENMTRNNYYGNTYTPHLFLDGNIDAGSSTGNWASRINSEIAVTSPLDIDINGTFDSSARTGVADITIIATAAITNTNLKVRIAIIESNINRSSPNGTTIHNQTFRDLTPNATGISLTIANGDTVNLSQAYATPSPLVLANCDIVVFVQSDSGHRILQGVKRNVMTMDYALDPFTLIAPTNGAIIPTCPPTVAWHRSNDPDSGYAIHYLAYLNFTNSFTNPFLTSDTLSDTTWSPPLCLPNDSTYYWKVVAFNGHAPQRNSTQTFHFTVSEPPILTPFALISPSDHDTVEICSPPLVWHQSTDPDLVAPVQYQVLLSRTTSFVTPFVVSDTLSDTTWTPPICLPNDSTYHWKVIAFNGHGPTRSCDAAFTFVVKEPPTGCIYIVGDINGSNTFNGLDVTYGVGYFKGGSPPSYSCECTTGHSWFVAGDVNGSCSFNGLDVTYGVAYFKGGPTPTPCPSCPPAR